CPTGRSACAQPGARECAAILWVWHLAAQRAGQRLLSRNPGAHDLHPGAPADAHAMTCRLALYFSFRSIIGESANSNSSTDYPSALVAEEVMLAGCRRRFARTSSVMVSHSAPPGVGKTPAGDRRFD